MKQIIYGIYPEDFKELRENAKYSQQKMANSLGVSLNTVQKWEAGSSIPLTKHLSEMAAMHGVIFQITPETKEKHPNLKS